MMGDNFEIPLARIGDVTNKNEIGSWIKLSQKEFGKFNNKKIDDGDILMTMTGDPPDVRKVNYINLKDEKKIIAYNQRVARLKIINKLLNNKYLFAYLSTELARFQADRKALGIRQRNLSTQDLKETIVAIPNKEDEKIMSHLYEPSLDHLSCLA